MYFLKNKVFTYFLLVLSIVAGTYLMNATPKELYPEIKIPTVIVSTVYPGASAKDVEESVTEKLEDVMVGGLKNIDEITSRSQEGVSIITAQFFEDVDIKEALIDVQDKVDQKKSELPADAEEPVVKKVNFSDQPIFTFALSSTEVYNNLRAQAEEIESEILKIKGVSEVVMEGIPEREITVLLDPQKLSRFGIEANQVVNAITRSKRTFPAGSIISDEREYRISYDSNIDTADDLSSIVVSSGAKGENIYVSDLALRVEDGLAKYETYTRIANPENRIPQQSVIFNVKKQSGGNIIKLTDAVIEKLNAYKQDHADEQIDFTITLNAGQDIRDNLSDLVGSGFQTIILILIVMGLMVGFRESLIAAIAVPLSFLLAFIGMSFFGITINFITLFSLILVIGILIDSAIVIVEGIYDFTAEGMNFFDASVKTLKEFSKPVVAGALTTISIFVPLMMLSGMLGQFIGGIPRVIIIVLIMSLVVALVFIPAVASIVYRLPIREPKWLMSGREKIFASVNAWYKKFITDFIANRRKKYGLVISLTLLIISSFMLVGLGWVKSEFFTADEIKQAYINIELDQGTSLEATSLALREVEEAILDQDHIVDITSIIGSESSFVGQGRSGSHYANIIANVSSKEFGQAVSSELREKLGAIDAFKVQVLVPESGPPVGAPFQVKIKGDSWDNINIAAEKVAAKIREIPAARNVESGVDVGLTEITLDVRHDRLAEYGLSALDISSTLRTALYGSTATSLNLANEGDVDVVVKIALDPAIKSHRDSNKLNYSTIKNLPIQTNKGEVLLSYFVEEKLDQATTTANHIDGLKNRTVTSYVKDGYLPIDITTAFNKISSEIELGEGVSFELAGADDESSKASSELMVSLVLGLLLIFGVLIWQFGSLRDVLFILSVIPLGLIGVIYGLFFANITLSFTAMLGFIALVGVIVNDSIILVDVMNKIRLRNPELPKREVVVRGATARLRPVLLTTITTVLGMIPLLYVSPMWKPFAFAMITGLSFATILTLVVIPMFYEKWSK